MIKLILSIKDYLTVCLGAYGAMPSASLYLCEWVKAEYPTLTTEETLTIAACLIRLTTTTLQRNPTQKVELDKAVSNMLSTRQ